MSFRNVAIFALLAAAPVFATVQAGAGVNAEPLGAGGVGANISPQDISAGGGVDLLHGAVDAGAGLDIKPVPRRHRRQLSTDQLGALGVSQVFTELTGTVTPVLAEIESLVADLTAPAEQIVSQVTAKLTSLTGLLKGGLGSLNGLTTSTKSVDASKTVPSNQATASQISDLTSAVAQTLQGLNGVVSDIPGLGAPLAAATKEIESTLSSVVGLVGQLAAPVLQILQGLLAPVEGILSDVGLGSVTSILGGIL